MNYGISIAIGVFVGQLLVRVVVPIVGAWLNKRAPRKLHLLLGETRDWWKDHHRTRAADYEAELSYWRVNGKSSPMPIPRPGPPARMRM